MERESLGRAVDVDIRDRLKGGDGGHIDDVRAAGHVRDHGLTHGHDRAAVEIHHIEVSVQRIIDRGAEFAVSAGIDQPADLRFFGFQRLRDDRVGTAVGQIQREHAERAPDRFAQGFQTVGAAGDDPHLLQTCMVADGFGKQLSHAAGGARDDGNTFHMKSSFPPPANPGRHPSAVFDGAEGAKNSYKWVKDERFYNEIVIYTSAVHFIRFPFFFQLFSVRIVKTAEMQTQNCSH